MLEKLNYPIFLLCKVMCVSKSGFKDKNHHFEFNFEEEIRKIHTSSRGTYGRRRILSTLKKSFIKVGKKRVSKIMKKLNLNGIGKPKFKITTKIAKQAIYSPNLISGDFTSYKPNELWTSDITYIPTKEGRIYLCIILDAFSSAIIGWSMQNNLKRELVLNSLNMAYKKRFHFPK